MKKKILASILTMCMLLSLFPSAAFATGETGAVDGETVTTVEPSEEQQTAPSDPQEEAGDSAVTNDGDSVVEGDSDNGEQETIPAPGDDVTQPDAEQGAPSDPGQEQVPSDEIPAASVPVVEVKIGDQVTEYTSLQEAMTKAAEASKIAKNNVVVTLLSDVDLSGTDWTAVDVGTITIDGQGHTISNLKDSKHYLSTPEGKEFGAGFIWQATGTLTIRDITFDHASICEEDRDNNVIGIVVGYTYGTTVFDNVKVTNSVVYGYGKVGVLLGMGADPGVDVTFTDCVSTGNTIKAMYDAGGLAGNIQRAQKNQVAEVEANVQITGCVVDNDFISFAPKKIVELDTKVAADDKDSSGSTCGLVGKPISGLFWDDGVYYWPAYADYYCSYGSSSHDCKLEGYEKPLANSEYMVGPVAEVDGEYYTTLADAIDAAKNGGTVKLVNTVTGVETIELSNGNTINLNLNGFDLKFKPDNFFKVTHGVLNVIGEGTMESSPKDYNYPVLYAYGCETDEANHSVITIGEDVTIRNLTGYGVGIGHTNYEAYGAKVVISGKIDAKYGFSVTGNAKATTGVNLPEVTVKPNASIYGSSGAIYAAGYAKYKVAGALEGKNFGIEIRAGELTIEDTAKITASGDFSSPAPNGNGSTVTGATIAVSQHATNLPIKVDIKGGDISESGTNGYALYEIDTVREENGEDVAKNVAISITGGTFTGGVYSTNQKLSITGGTYSEKPDEKYLASGYAAFQDSNVYVVGKPVASITLNKSELSMYLNAEETLVATVKPDDAYQTVTWTTSDDKVATVSDNGAVTAVGLGAATITAEAGGKTAECKVTVTNAPVGSLTLDHTKLSMVEGGMAELKAKVEPENADQTVTWSSSDETVATVNGGTVTAVNAGTATITAKAGGLTAECQVTVTADDDGTTVIPSVEEPKVDTSDKVPENVKDVVTEAAESVAADKALSDAAAQQAQQVESKKDELVEQAKNEGLTVPEGQDVNLYTQVYMKIQVEAAKVENGNITSITMDITPMVKVIASTADSSAEIQIGTNAVEVRSETLELTQASVTVQLPEAFKDHLVYVKHEASSNNTYYYKGEADKNGVLTFTTRNGFSPFTFSVKSFEDVAAWIDGEGYASLEAAVSAVENNGTIVLAKNNEEKIEVRRNVTFTIQSGDKVFNPKNITAGSRYDMSLKVDGTNYTYDFDRDSSGSSSSSGSYTVSVDAGKHGSVKVSPSRADKGDTVTITVKPDKGYELDELTVTDKDGDSIKIKDKGNGKFTFTMPASKVTVEASFQKVETQPEQKNPFSDVDEGDYYYDAVLWAVEQNITSGVAQDLFAPGTACTRGQIVTFLWRANGSPVVDYAMDFVDVPADAYYAEAVRWAVSKGITSGTGEGTFSPDATVTRGQTVTFLWRANGSPAASGSAEFADVSADAYYAPAVAWAVSEDITAGTGAGAFSPDAPCTRGQIVTFLWKDAK